MEEFKQGSDEIENIIRTIDNIAFQTNILVLNSLLPGSRGGVGSDQGMSGRSLL